MYKIEILNNKTKSWEEIQDDMNSFDCPFEAENCIPDLIKSSSDYNEDQINPYLDENSHYHFRIKGDDIGICFQSFYDEEGYTARPWADPKCGGYDESTH